MKNQPNEQLVQDLVVYKESEAPSYLKMLARRFTECCKGYYIPAVAIFERKLSYTVRVRNRQPSVNFPQIQLDSVLISCFSVQKGADGAIIKDGMRKLLVTEESATNIGLPESEVIKIPFLRDHSSLVKFSSRSDMDYIQILDHIKQFTAAPCMSPVCFAYIRTTIDHLCGVTGIPTAKKKYVDVLREAERVVSDVGRCIVDAEKELFRGQSMASPFMEQERVAPNSDCSWITVSSGQGKSSICKNSAESIGNKTVDDSQSASVSFYSGRMSQAYRDAETVARSAILKL